MSRNRVPTPCTVTGCQGSNPYGGRLCPMHKTRLARHGSTDGRPGWGETVQQGYERLVVRSDGCWSWTGPKNERGYGHIRHQYAHRIAYELFVGPIPDGLFVLHRCDNPPCTNPEHLFIGTHADNMADANRKGRLDGRPNRPLGEAVGTSKLTGEQVREMRRLAGDGWTTKALAERFGVCADNVRLIKSRRRWTHV